MGRGAGTDLYKFVVQSIEGATAVIDFYSSQSLGLEGTDDEVWWVDQLAGSTGAFVDRQAACPLTQHEAWHQNGHVLVQGFTGIRDLEHLQTEKACLLAAVGGADPALAQLRCGSGGSIRADGVSMEFYLDSVEQAQRFIDAVTAVCSAATDESARWADVQANFKLALRPPTCVSRFDYPRECFVGFLATIERVSVEYERLDANVPEDWAAHGVQPSSWNSKATFRVNATNEDFLTHLRDGEEWCGR